MVVDCGINVIPGKDLSFVTLTVKAPKCVSAIKKKKP